MNPHSRGLPLIIVAVVLSSCAMLKQQRTEPPAAKTGETLAAPKPASGLLAAKVDCSGSQRMKQQLTWQAIEPGDTAGHELAQFTRMDTIASNNADFDGAEQTVYGHLDQIKGTGSEQGYNVSTLKNGDKVWSRFEGTHYFVPKGEANWEIAYYGTFRYIAGTGKYKAIRGGGYYRGVATPNGNSGQFFCEAEY
jgi:hypothetical protein